MSNPVRVRIAPSPTGDPHVGTAYIALFNQAFARQNGGRFILRIEDTDQARSKPEYEQGIYKALRWVGLSWDEGPDVGGECGPYRQSERLSIYKDHAEILLEKGSAYPCFCTPETLTELRQSQEKAGKDPRYDGRCRDIDLKDARARIANGEKAVVRLKVPREGSTLFHDEIRGDITLQNQDIDDQVIVKSDGFPTYHLANVVDDHLMGITHVIRGGDWIISTPKHILLYNAFGWEAPSFSHLPLLLNPDKSKISKRKSPTSLTWYEEKGILPEALLNFLGLLGYSMEDGTEIFDFQTMAKTFDVSRIKGANSVFDITKLEWLNGMYLRELGTKELAEKIKNFGVSYPDDATLEAAVPLIQERIKYLSDVEERLGFFFRDRELQYEATDLLPKKKKDPVEVGKVLEAFRVRLEAFTGEMIPADVEALCVAQAEEMEWKKGDFFMALRIAVTGSKVTPPLCESMEILGRDTVLQRLAVAVEKLKSFVPTQ